MQRIVVSIEFCQDEAGTKSVGVKMSSRSEKTSVVSFRFIDTVVSELKKLARLEANSFRKPVRELKGEGE